MAELSLIDLYDLAKMGESRTKWFSQYEPPFGVGSREGKINVWLVEETDVQTTLNPEEMTAQELETAVFEFVDEVATN